MYISVCFAKRFQESLVLSLSDFGVSDFWVICPPFGNHEITKIPPKTNGWDLKEAKIKKTRKTKHLSTFQIAR